jgi:DNA repair protein RadD
VSVLTVKTICRIVSLVNRRYDTVKLRPFQAKAKAAVYAAWAAGAKNTLLVEPTGAGKTVIFSDIINEHDGPSVAIAHRQELVSQISLALARNEVRHRIIGPQTVVRTVVNLHMLELGRSYYDPRARCGVAGVDTLVRRQTELAQWLHSVTLWIQDEAHHVLTKNKWGKAATMFPNARGLGVTATPERADGKGLGRHASGLFDHMNVGPSARDLIEAGYLTDYRIFAPPSDLDLSDVNTTASGDYSAKKLKFAVRRSHVVGDVVSHYLRIAPGKLGITFATDVETATDITAQFNAAGVPAAVVSADTPAADRVAILRRFKNRELLQLVNVDLFGEGFDLPAIEVVSMARPTQSYALYCQQFGRGLRLMVSDTLNATWGGLTDRERLAHIAASGKPHAIIIDHVNNVERHGLPDAHRSWSLNDREKRSKGAATDVIPVRACPACTAVYERIYKTCPFCGHTATPAARNGPEFVDGDLTELDPATLAAMRGEIARVDLDREALRDEQNRKRVASWKSNIHVARHVERQEAQRALRASIAWWAGWQRSMNRSDVESYRRFYFMFGVDVMTAQALKASEALELANRVNIKLGEMAA